MSRVITPFRELAQGRLGGQPASLRRLVVLSRRRFIDPLFNHGRESGVWAHADLERMAWQVCEVPGDFAEIGVFQGQAFQKLSLLASRQKKIAHAFDSFLGMDEPGPFDGPEYPRGLFDIGGSEAFVAMMMGRGVPHEAYRLHPGYIPNCFAGLDPRLRFSLAIIDVDHYQPTRQALAWVWPRMSASGLLGLDDFFFDRDTLASRAIKEFLRDQHDFDPVAYFNQQLIVRKVPAA